MTKPEYFRAVAAAVIRPAGNAARFFWHLFIITIAPTLGGIALGWWVGVALFVLIFFLLWVDEAAKRFIEVNNKVETELERRLKKERLSPFVQEAGVLMIRFRKGALNDKVTKQAFVNDVESFKSRLREALEEAVGASEVALVESEAGLDLSAHGADKFERAINIRAARLRQLLDRL